MPAKYTRDRPPNATDDRTRGYEVGDVWEVKNVAIAEHQKQYRCIANAPHDGTNTSPSWLLVHSND